MPRLDLQRDMVDGAIGFVAGGGQRMAWEASETIGLITTGGVILGGVLLETMANQPLLQQLGHTGLIAGTAVGGWVAAEKFLIEGSEGRRIGHLPAQRAALERASREEIYTGRSNGVVHRAMVPLNDDDVTVL